MDSTSISLLKRLRQPKQEAAWHRFVDLYAPLIFHWGRGQGLDATDAADLVQDVMAFLFKKLPEFEYDSTKRFRGWLKTVTVNKARDFQRRIRPKVSGEETIHSVAAANDVDLLDENEFRGFLVGRALDLMRAEFQEKTWRACWLHVVEGKTAREIACELNISVNMVYLAKSRVLSRLREELDGMMD